jgi:hypothetical protein
MRHRGQVRGGSFAIDGGGIAVDQLLADQIELTSLPGLMSAGRRPGLAWS